MKTDVWMPLFIGDYMTATSRLTTEQHGAYLLLIMDYWKNGPLPDNDQILAQITRMRPDAWSNARAVLAEFFKVANGQWRHTRIEREMADAAERKGKAKDKARKAAEARWAGKDDATSNASGNATEVLEQCPSPSPSPSSLSLPSKSPEKDSADAQAEKPAKVSVTAKDLVNDYGINPQKAAEWLAIRKEKRKKLTPSAMDSMITEAGKAGLSLSDAVSMCVAEGWAGFKASYAKGRNGNGGQQQETHHERGLRMARERGIIK